ncbi:MAG: hypothetical protein A2Z38_01895 [Planctomycetes bacterium RBG_19FT_COMBO_48_8]|nr:MAG: hypothetical protein A2Z38_01895 [Planctomycetes bacterium RBG_19FT_COMBO_48_8]
MHLVLAIGAPYGERKNQKKRFFLSKSMPNFNFTEAFQLSIFPPVLTISKHSKKNSINIIDGNVGMSYPNYFQLLVQIT